MIRKLYAGSTSEPIPIYIQNSTTGSGLGSLTYSTSGLVAEYRRKGQSSWTSITLASGTLGTWSSGGFVADGNLTGAYELGIPNAALATGAEWCLVRLYGATNMAPVLMLFELDAVNYQSATSFVTSVPAIAAGGLDNIVTETGVNLAQAVAIILDAVCAQLSGLPSGPIVVRDVNNTVNRITVSFDANDNRTALTLNLPSV